MWSIEDIRAEIAENSSANRGDNDRTLRYELKFRATKTGLELIRVSDILAAVKRPVSDITTFYRDKLRVNIKHESTSDCIKIAGMHNPIQLKEIFALYIKEQVICENCGLHDTTYSGGIISCTACGHSSESRQKLQKSKK